MYINTVIHSPGHIYTQNIQGDRTVNNSSNHLKSRIESSSYLKSLAESQQRSESYADIYLELKDICGGSDDVFITSPEDDELISTTNEQLHHENLATLNGKSSHLCAWNRDFSYINCNTLCTLVWATPPNVVQNFPIPGVMSGSDCDKAASCEVP